MAFEITKSFVVRAPPARVWAFLVDARKVASCMPGAAITEQIDERTYAGTMTVKVGPVQASYRGKIVFEQLDESAGRAAIVATGQDVRGKGGADLRLTSSVASKGDGETEVTAVSRVNVSGILAQMGRGMVEDVGDQIFQIFSQRMREELEAAGAPGANGVAASSSPVFGSDGRSAAEPSRPRPSPPEGGEGSTANVPVNAAVVAPSPELAAGGRPPSPATAGEGTGEGPQRASAAPSPPTVEPFDAGALGAKVARRAAGRALSGPTPLWLSLLLCLAVLYLLLR
ncbi:MAG TPA: SRPBCC family protein [Anaeromyxobacteraceae bacterium]|nr:SRPBCC family protein [Anaeromyxobacteraceae bacterium]